MLLFESQEPPARQPDRADTCARSEIGPLWTLDHGAAVIGNVAAREAEGRGDTARARNSRYTLNESTVWVGSRVLEVEILGPRCRWRVGRWVARIW